MTPTNEQVVAACQRAGIKEVQHGHETLIWNSETPAYVSVIDDGSLYSETTPGSALFIVAVLRAFKRDMFAFELRCNDVLDLEKGWAFRWTVITQPEQELECWDMTLTAACMAAIVAAFPPKEVGE